MAQAKENNPAPRAKAPAAPKAAAANGTAPAGEKRTRPTTRRPYYNRRPRRAQQPKEAATPIHIYPLGGLGEVGKNMTVYECNGDMIIVDCGLVFPDSEMFGVDMVIPDFTFVVQNKDKIKGLLITHGHEDHIGSIPYLLQKFDLPIYGTRLTCGLIKNKLEEFGLAGKTKFVEIVPRQKIKLGCFTVEPIHVNHSIPDAVAFAIDSPAGTIIQTGDFKIDYTPLACGVTDLSTLSEYGQRGVLALLSDSTNAERPGFTATEQKVAAGVRSLFARARNKRIIIATFASNIYRVQQIIDLAVEDGRKVAFSGRSMVNNTAMAQELGYMHIPEGTLIGVEELNQYPPEQVVLITTGSQGEPLSALSRMASCSHRQVRVGPGDFIIISANPIPGNEKSVTKIVNGLLLLGAEVYVSRYLMNNPDLTPICITGTRCALLEHNFSDNFGTETLDRITALTCDHGIRPILAHIERYKALMDHPGLIDELRDMGCATQVNISAFANASFGARRKLLKYLDSGRIDLIGSDCHNLGTRPPDYADGAAVIVKKFGDKMPTPCWAAESA